MLLKNPENLCEQRGEKAHLAAALELNEPLATGYYLKEELRLFWEHTFRWPPQMFVRSWCQRAIAIGLSPLRIWTVAIKDIAKTPMRLGGPLSYLGHRITSGPMERHQQQNQNA